MKLSPAVRRTLERLHILKPRRGRVAVWAQADAGLLAPPVVSGGTLSAKIIRADGIVEDLGVIATLKEVHP